MNMFEILAIGALIIYVITEILIKYERKKKK